MSKESQFKSLEMFNLKKLAEISQISYAKLYFRKTGKTEEEVSHKDATKIANGIKKSLDPLFKKLGFIVQVSRIEEN